MNEGKKRKKEKKERKERKERKGKRGNGFERERRRTTEREREMSAKKTQIPILVVARSQLPKAQETHVVLKGIKRKRERERERKRERERNVVGGRRGEERREGNILAPAKYKP